MLKKFFLPLIIAFFILAFLTAFSLTSLAEDNTTSSEVYGYEDLIKGLEEMKGSFSFDNSNPPPNAMAVLPKYNPYAFPDFYEEDFDDMLKNFQTVRPREGGYHLEIKRFDVVPQKISLGQNAKITLEFNGDYGNTVFYALYVKNGQGGNIDQLASIVLGTVRKNTQRSHLFYANLPTKAEIVLLARDLLGNSASKTIKITVTKYPEP